MKPRKKMGLMTLCLLLQSTEGFAQVSTTYADPKGQFTIDHGEWDTVTIQYDYQIETLTQEHWTVDDLFQMNDWKKVVDYSFGKRSLYLHQGFMEEFSDDLHNFAVKNNFTPYRMISMFIAFANALEKVHHPTYRLSLFYFPYELVVTGVHKDLDRQSLLAGLLSVFCFDATIAVSGRDMVVGVLVEGEGDLYYREQKYKAMREHYSFDELPSIHSYSPICKFQKIYQNPIKPYFTHQLREMKYSGSDQFVVQNQQVSPGRYDAQIATTPEYREALSALQRDPHRQQYNQSIKGYVIGNVSSQLKILGEIR